MTTTRRFDAGFGFPLGCAAGVVVTLAAVAAGATRHPLAAALALAAVVLVCGMLTTMRAAAGVAVVCWCLHDGFVLGRHGQLVFTGASAVVAGILAAAVVSGAAATTVHIRPRRANP